MLTLAIALLGAAAGLCFLELFVPSMGLITALAIGCAGGSCMAAFQIGRDTGWLFVGLNLAGMIAGFAVAIKLLPRSPLALRKTSVEEGGYQPVEAPGELVGRSGVAFTTLRPGGTALIAGRKVDVVAVGGFIERDERVKVVKVEGTKVLVIKETA